MPSMLYLLAPLCVLIAVLITFGLMEKANEITAMKACGISVYRAMVPMLALAAMFSAGLYFFNEYYLPSANRESEALRNSIKGRPAQTFLRPDRMWIFGKNSSIYYYEYFDADKNSFGNISVFEFDPQTFYLTKRVYAARAHWEPTLNRFIFENGWERSLNGSVVTSYRTFDVSTFPELVEDPGYFKKEIKQYTEMSSGQLRAYIHDMERSGFDVVRLKIQLWKKYSYPTITLVMAMLAVPFSLKMGRKGALAGVAVALGIAIVYLILSNLFEAMGNVSQLPPALAAWAPDMFFAFAGGYLVLRVPT
jgi:LPS export ABC transporter permease LptG